MAMGTIKAISFCCLLKSRNVFIFYTLNPGLNKKSEQRNHPLKIAHCHNFIHCVPLAEDHHKKTMRESTFSFLCLLCCCTSLKQILLSYFKRKWNRYTQRNRTRSPFTIFCFSRHGPENNRVVTSFPLLGQRESGSDVS